MIRIAGCNTNHPDYTADRPDTYVTAYDETVTNTFDSRFVCRQLGRYDHEANQWIDLDDCDGCEAPKDLVYIKEGREDLDRRSGR